MSGARGQKAGSAVRSSTPGSTLCNANVPPEISKKTTLIFIAGVMWHFQNPRVSSLPSTVTHGVPNATFSNSLRYRWTRAAHQQSSRNPLVSGHSRKPQNDFSPKVHYGAVRCRRAPRQCFIPLAAAPDSSRPHLSYHSGFLFFVVCLGVMSVKNTSQARGLPKYSEVQVIRDYRVEAPCEHITGMRHYTTGKL